MIDQIEMEVMIQWQKSFQVDKPLSSLLRGAFGCIVREKSCMRDMNGDCMTCDVNDQCSYVEIFNPIIENKGSLTRGTANVAFHFDHRTSFHQGEVFTFKMDVYHLGVDQIELIKAVVFEMGESGIGKERAPYQVLSIKVSDRTFLPVSTYRGQNQYLMIFETPLRILKNKKLLLENISARDVLISAMNRYDNLLREKLDMENAFVFDLLIGNLNEITEVDKQVFPYNMNRYSTRTKQSYEVDGILGFILIQANVSAELDEIMQSMVHYRIGKNTVSGYGQVKMIKLLD